LAVDDLRPDSGVPQLPAVEQGEKLSVSIPFVDAPRNGYRKDIAAVGCRSTADALDEIEEIADDLGLDRRANEEPTFTKRRTAGRQAPPPGRDERDPNQAPYPPKEPLPFRLSSFVDRSSR
jgi:hypothetical protein